MSRITRPARAATPDAAGQHGKAESARAAAAAHEAAPDEPTDDERDEFLHVRSRATKRNTKRPEGAVPSVFEMAARQRERHRQPAPIDADAVVFERGVPLVGQRHVITCEYDTLLARFEPGTSCVLVHRQAKRLLQRARKRGMLVVARRVEAERTRVWRLAGEHKPGMDMRRVGAKLK